MPEITALLVEDNSDFRQCINTLLDHDDSIRVIAETDNGKEAIELALQHQPDIIIMDINIPKVNGLQVIKEISAELPHSRIIALTGSEDAEHILHILSTGAHAYCPKIDMNQLLLKAIHSVQLGFHVVGGKLMNESTYTNWLTTSKNQAFMYRGASFRTMLASPAV